MSIISMKFVLFLIIAIIFYYVTPKRYQWKTLLVLSYCFYLISGVKTIIFLLVTSVSTYYAGIAIGKINDEYQVAVDNYDGPNEKITRQEKLAIKADEDKRKRKILIGLLLLNFGILIAIKYINAIGELLNGLCNLLHVNYEVEHVSMLIPLGISYYTFQAMGYLIDLYRRKHVPEYSLPRLMLFLAFFPQLIQGPISRYSELAQQLYEPHRFQFVRLRMGVELMAWGLFKKLVIADRIAIMTNTIFGTPEKYGGYYLVFATAASMLWLYADFSGGIDMVRGIAEIFGITLPENFVRPFFAANQSEYWRRWHISLNNWWRDYIFYPLSLSSGFNRFGKVAKKIMGDNFGKKLPVLLSVIVIRIINSIWHGATGSSILGGLYYGILLALSFYFENTIKRWTEKLQINTKCLSFRVFQSLRTFVLIAAPRLVSQAESLADGANYFKCLFKVNNPWIFFDGSLFGLGVSRPQFTVVFFALIMLLIISCIQEKGYVVREKLAEQNLLFRGIVYICFVYAIVLFGVYGSGYDASSFAYAQF